MNRIILIGNGFDLAHDLKTGYKDFMDDYWSKVIIQLKEKGELIPFENDEININQIPLGINNVESFNELNKLVSNRTRNVSRLFFTNAFFGIISKKLSLQNWVDIESEYYNLLKSAYKNKAFESIIKINTGFKSVKELLKSYLEKIEKQFDITQNKRNLRLKSSLGSKIYSLSEMRDFTTNYFNQKCDFELNRLLEFLDRAEKAGVNNIELKKFWETIGVSNEKDFKILRFLHKKPNKLKLIKEKLLSLDAYNYFDLIPNNVLFLSFNYTFTENHYQSPSKFRYYEPLNNIALDTIHIHGSLYKEDKNPIIFGYGDELDDDYKLIENLNDNRYLENIKSIKYLETDNYKKLLEYLNDESYQVFIFGHLCGLSDRTLLNTIFEHNNCVSIKPFYHAQENRDNYSDIVRNISRNFNSKVDMRDKVVNKTFCNSLS